MTTAYEDLIRGSGLTMLNLMFGSTGKIQRVTLTADNYGSQSESWADVTGLTALAGHFYIVSGREVERLRKLEVDADYGFLCDLAGTAITEKDRFVLSSINYDIVFVEPIGSSATAVVKLLLRKRI